MLTDRADETLTFTHLSFQEFLTAWHLNATVEGKEDRIQTFRRYLGFPIWWETLRLWAALIERQSPERLDPVLEDLSQSGDPGLSLSGMMLADGLGEEARLIAWIDLLSERLARGTWASSFDQCSRAWVVSRQEDRKAKLGTRMSVKAPEQTWPGWLRYDEFRTAIRQDMKFQFPQEGTLARIILSQLEEPTLDERSIAAGRILCSGPSLWPPESLDVGLLHGWPSQRRLAGLSLQLAVTCGATRNDFRLLAKEILRSSGPESIDSGLARDFARDFARDLARDFARDLARDFARDLARDLAQRTQLDEQAPWLESYAGYELLSFGRVAVRSLLASAELTEPPLLDLMIKACRHSFGRESATDDLLAPSSLPPLWPALARHIARLSTPRDRALLIDLAQHPEKCEPPLSWGLQYIVRGDILMEDGSVVTLNELADEVGLPHLPYLEDMPPELEIDWGDAE